MKRYSAKLTRLFEPLKPLLREEMEWTWSSSHQDAFDAIKKELSRAPVLAYFHRKAEHVITDECYPNIERELIGVMFAMERLHNYVFGAPVGVKTDHKPLEVI